MRLIEAIVAAAIVTVVSAAVFWAVASFGKHVAQQGGPARTAALLVAEQTLRVAQDAWKYGSPGSAPSGSQSITLPLRSATSAPATITTAISASTSPTQISVTVNYTPEPGRNGDTGVVTVTGQVDVKAPLPGSQVNRPGLIPLPSGAP